MHACTLSRFSCVQLFGSWWAIACQASLSMGFSRQEYCSELLPFASFWWSSRPRERAHISCISCIAGVFFDPVSHMGSPLSNECIEMVYRLYARSSSILSCCGPSCWAGQIELCNCGENELEPFEEMRETYWLFSDWFLNVHSCVIYREPKKSSMNYLVSMWSHMN